jgi:hypothetical protein
MPHGGNLVLSDAANSTDHHLLAELRPHDGHFSSPGAKMGWNKVTGLSHGLVSNKNSLGTLITRYVLDANGQSKNMVWSDASEDLISFFSEPEAQCDAYAVCGVDRLQFAERMCSRSAAAWKVSPSGHLRTGSWQIEQADAKEVFL